MLTSESGSYARITGWTCATVTPSARCEPKVIIRAKGCPSGARNANDSSSLVITGTPVDIVTPAVRAEINATSPGRTPVSGA